MSQRWLDIPVDALASHVFVAGSSGIGKTTAIEHLLLGLWEEHRIPFCVVEPALNASYRGLFYTSMGKELHVFSPGSPTGRQLPLHPFYALVGLPVQEYLAGVYQIIATATVLESPLPEILRSALVAAVRALGWQLHGTVQPHHQPLSLDAILAQVVQTVKAMDYGREIERNITGAFRARLTALGEGSLASVFASHSLSQEVMAEFFAKPTVVELAALSADPASLRLMAAAILQQMRHHWRLAGRSEKLRHLTVFEEAHRIYRHVPMAPPASQELNQEFANLLAELRGMGAGFLISDQRPSALLSDVLANTATKIAFSLRETQDQLAMAESLGLTAAQLPWFAQLTRGRALVSIPDQARPYHIAFPQASLRRTRPGMPTDAELNPVPLLSHSTQPPTPIPLPGVPQAGVTCPNCHSQQCKPYAKGVRVRRNPTIMQKMRELAQQSQIQAQAYARTSFRLTPSTFPCFWKAFCI